MELQGLRYDVHGEGQIYDADKLQFLFFDRPKGSNNIEIQFYYYEKNNCTLCHYSVNSGSHSAAFRECQCLYFT